MQKWMIIKISTLLLLGQKKKKGLAQFLLVSSTEIMNGIEHK